MAAVGELVKLAKKATGVGTKKTIPKAEEEVKTLKAEASKTTVPEPTPATSHNADMTDQVTDARTRGEDLPKESPSATPAQGVTGEEKDALTGAKTSGYEDIDYAPMGGEKKAALESTVPTGEKPTGETPKEEKKNGGFFSRWRDKPNEFQQQTDQAIEDWQKQSGGSFNIGEIGEKQNLFTLMANFENLFGKQLAEHLKIIDLKNSILVLKASNSVWKTESEYQKKAIIERCNGLLGAKCVKNIRFV